MSVQLPNLDQIAPVEDLQTLACLITGQLHWRDINEAHKAALIQVAAAHNLLPMVYHTTGQYQHDAHWFAEDLQHYLLGLRGRAGLLTTLALEINSLLADYRPIWIKGITLAHTVYPEPWLRPMLDLDFIVPLDVRVEALETLRAAGYTYVPRTAAGQLIPVEIQNYFQHHYVLRKHNIVAELHYDLGFREVSGLSAGALGYLWDHTRTVDVMGGQLLSLDPELQLIVCATHDVLQHQQLRHNQKPPNVDFKAVRKLDLHLLMTHNSLDWDRLAQHLAWFNWHTYTQRAVEQTLEIFETSVDVDAMWQALTPENPTHTDLEANKTYLNYRSGLRLMSLMTRREKFQYLWNNVLFIAPEFMREQYNIPANRPVWPYYLFRVVEKGVQLVGLSLRALHERH